MTEETPLGKRKSPAMPNNLSSDAARMRRLRAKREAAKTCNQCEDPPEEGTNTCEIHKFKNRQRQKNRRRRLSQLPY